jgi:GNAT superfamily N-acetyltransferase
MSISDGYHSLAPGKVASVVTYVEMTARPDWVDNEFEGRLRRVESWEPESYRAMFRRVGQDYLWFSRLRASDVDIRARFARETVSVYLFDGSGESGIGLVESERTAADEVEISLFGLVPGATRRGLGRAMMAHVLREAWANGTKRVWLRTCTLDDPRALGFYRKMGFRPYARGIEIAEDPRRQGYLPETAAPQVPLI